MDLVRSWLGQALRATGAAVMVPVAILVALSFTAIGGGGLGGLGGLSQIVSGPQAAGSGVSVDDGDSEIADAVTQLAASEPASPAVTAPAGGGALPGTPGAPTVPGGGDGPVAPNGPGEGPGGGGDGVTDPGGGGGEPPASGPPAAPPPGSPGVVEGVGRGVQDVTSGTPVGPTVEDAVDSLVETCGRLGCP